jgi:hypothetical protein
VYSTSVRFIGVELPAFLRNGHGTFPELLYSIVKRELESLSCIHESLSFKLFYLLVKTEREREREMESMICIHESVPFKLFYLLVKRERQVESMVCIHEGASFVHESIHSQ